jgi:hypothetical protein
LANCPKSDEDIEEEADEFEELESNPGNFKQHHLVRFENAHQHRLTANSKTGGRQIITK